MNFTNKPLQERERAYKVLARPLDEDKRRELLYLLFTPEEIHDIAEKMYLRRLGCSEESVEIIKGLWSDLQGRRTTPESHDLVLEFSAKYLAEKKVRDPAGFIIAELRELLGIENRKPPPEPRPLTAREKVDKELKALFQGRQRSTGRMRCRSLARNARPGQGSCLRGLQSFQRTGAVTDIYSGVRFRRRSRGCYQFIFADNDLIARVGLQPLN